MLSTEVNWQELRHQFEYVESDSFAVFRNGNSLRWVPAFLNAATGKPFVQDNGKWVAVEDVRGFERFQKIIVWKKTFYDPLRAETIEVRREHNAN
jgi:hypothetical protein